MIGQGGEFFVWETACQGNLECPGCFARAGSILCQAGDGRHGVAAACKGWLYPGWCRDSPFRASSLDKAAAEKIMVRSVDNFAVCGAVIHIFMHIFNRLSG